jgi:hypothetical protein
MQLAGISLDPGESVAAIKPWHYIAAINPGGMLII